MKIPPRIVAEVAINSIRQDVKHGVVAIWTYDAVGRLAACVSITQDWEMQGWHNEARFLAHNYAPRHNLEW
jgi:hypothetical protein